MKGKIIKKSFLLGIIGVLFGVGLAKPVKSKAEYVYPGQLVSTTEGEKFKYYDGTGSYKYVTDGIRRINNKKYYFDEKGIMKKNGWVMFESQWYFADEQGRLVTGWKKIKGRDYYFYPSSKMAYGVTINNKWIISNDGHCIGAIGQWKEDQKGWAYLKYDGTWARNEIITSGVYKYYFEGYYLKEKAWIKIKNNDKTDWYYAGDDGRLLTGWQTIEGIKYYFDSSGKLLQNTRIWGKYDLDEKGTVKASGTWKLKNGKYWYDMPGKYYHPSTGTITYEPYPKNTIYWINGKKYYFDEEGYRITGWLDINKFIGGTSSKPRWVYIKPDGTFYPMGWQKIGKRTYYVKNEEGEIATNITIGKYKFDSDGAYTIGTGDERATGWVQYGKKWRYEFKSGTYYASCIQEIDARTYAFDSDGYMLTGWVDKNKIADTSAYGSVWYYFDENGCGYNGWVTYEGAEYYCRNGLMAHDEFINGYYVDHNGKYSKTAPVYVDTRVKSSY